MWNANLERYRYAHLPCNVCKAHSKKLLSLITAYRFPKCGARLVGEGEVEGCSGKVNIVKWIAYSFNPVEAHQISEELGVQNELTSL
jgi:hypothetical protein